MHCILTSIVNLDFKIFMASTKVFLVNGDGLCGIRMDGGNGGSSGGGDGIPVSVWFYQQT